MSRMCHSVQNYSKYPLDHHARSEKLKKAVKYLYSKVILILVKLLEHRE